MTTMRPVPGMNLLARLRRPSRATLAASAPIALALAVLTVAASSSVRARLDWVPVEHDNIALDALLVVVLGIVLTVVAVVVVLPLSLVIHQAGHALGGHLVGMRLLAMRAGPLLVEPAAATGHVTRLPLRGRDDLLVAWTHLDDSPLPAWRRPRGWQVVLIAGPGMSLAVAFLCAMASIFAGPLGYVLLRQMVWINLAICVVALLPVPILGVASDGRRLYTLLANGDAADALLEQLRNEIVVGPTRPGAWPRERLTAWETTIRQGPASAERREEQLELAVYLMLHALDRGDRDAAWQWSQTLQTLLGGEVAVDSIAADLARVVLALHTARWDDEPEMARRHLDRIGATSEIRHSPWHTVARAAIAVQVGTDTLPDREERLLEALALAEEATRRLTDAAKLHGIDQLMRGLAQAIASDAGVELQRSAHAAAADEAA